MGDGERSPGTSAPGTLRVGSDAVRSLLDELVEQLDGLVPRASAPSASPGSSCCEGRAEDASPG